jgi:hypothetical protein
MPASPQVFVLLLCPFTFPFDMYEQLIYSMALVGTRWALLFCMHRRTIRDGVLFSEALVGSTWDELVHRRDEIPVLMLCVCWMLRTK